MGRGWARKREARCAGLLLASCLVALATGPRARAASETRVGARSEIRVAAAPDLTRAFTQLAGAFERKTNCKVTLIFGSSGQLAQQIRNGAPYDVFASANQAYVSDLDRGALLLSDSRREYAEGHLVIWTRRDAPHPDSLQAMTAASYARVAIANPDTAPYGKAAREAIEKAGLWNSLKPRIVYGENIQQTLQFAATGNADAAVVALSLAIGSDGVYSSVPGALYAPLRQEIAILRSTARPAEARRFVAFVCGPDGRATLARFGFTSPHPARRLRTGGRTAGLLPAAQ